MLQQKCETSWLKGFGGAGVSPAFFPHATHQKQIAGGTPAPQTSAFSDALSGLKFDVQVFSE
jgi:hypothetical protein